MKKVFVFSGPSGVGKSTLIKYLLTNLEFVGMTISCTTRAPRFDEVHGVDYYFISSEEFEKLIKDGEFLEHVECYGNRYGTLKREVSNVLKSKDVCILDLEFEGAYNVISKGEVNFKSIGVLILPPSMKSLKNRLINRKTETEESLKKRIKESFRVKEIANYEYVIINDDLEKSKQDITDIITSA
ncbi:MAG: guanylate kinase [Holosporales bacterium]|jgi:guanylate kinase|nr:guanylate kinase [Holosporales bacterium]